MDYLHVQVDKPWYNYIMGLHCTVLSFLQEAVQKATKPHYKTSVQPKQPQDTGGGDGEEVARSQQVKPEHTAQKDRLAAQVLYSYHIFKHTQQASFLVFRLNYM